MYKQLCDETPCNGHPELSQSCLYTRYFTSFVLFTCKLILYFLPQSGGGCRLTTFMPADKTTTIVNASVYSDQTVIPVNCYIDNWYHEASPPSPLSMIRQQVFQYIYILHLVFLYVRFIKLYSVHIYIIHYII